MVLEYYPGITIKRLRKERVFSLLDLERNLSINNGFLSLVERGKRKLSLNNLIKIADFFDVSLEYLIYGRLHKNPQTAELLEILHSREELKDLLLCCKEIESDYIIEVIHTIEDMVKKGKLKLYSDSTIIQA